MNSQVPRFRYLIFILFLVLICGSSAATRAQSEGSVGALVNLPSGSAKRKPTRPATRPAPGRPKPVADNSEQVEAALELGDQERAANPPRNTEAEKAYLLAAKLGPRDARPHVGLGNIYYDQKKYSEAESEYRRGALLNPADGTAYARLAFMYSERYQNEKSPSLLDQAIGFARRATAAQSSNYYCFVALGWTTYLKGDYPSAEAAYRRSIELSPAYTALYVELARVLTSQRRYRDAMVPLTKAIELDPKNYTAQFFAGVMQQKLGQLDRSAEHYTVAIQLNPKASEARSNVGLIYYMLSQWSKAREQWNAAINLGSTYAPDRIGLLVLDGNLTDARTQLQEYTRNNADDEDGWLMLGDVLRALGDESGARAADTRAAQIAPNYVGLKRPTLSRAGVSSDSSGSSSDRLGARSRDASTSIPKAAQLVGTWRASVSEFGLQYEIFVRFASEGTTTYLMRDTMGRTQSARGTWRYSDGMLYEGLPSGGSGKASIQWVDNDSFVLTIIDNGVPAYSGLKRYYHRQ
jgi:tetratricopeptide (TPR) repeat protein